MARHRTSRSPSPAGHHDAKRARKDDDKRDRARDRRDTARDSRRRSRSPVDVRNIILSSRGRAQILTITHSIDTATENTHATVSAIAIVTEGANVPANAPAIGVVTVEIDLLAGIVAATMSGEEGRVPIAGDGRLDHAHAHQQVDVGIEAAMLVEMTGATVKSDARARQKLSLLLLLAET